MNIKEYLKSFLGIKELEQRIEALEKKVNEGAEKETVELPPLKKSEKKTLKALSNNNPFTTSEIAQKLDKSRSYTSQLLNSLSEKGYLNRRKEGRVVYYSKVIEL